MLHLGPGVTLERALDLSPFTLPFDLLFPGRDIADLDGARDWLAPLHVDFAAQTILLDVQSHVLRIGDKVILIDTCVGEHKHRPRRADWHNRAATGYLDRLAALGLRAEDVDVVFCTHLHTDHVGWNTRLENGRWVPTFPRARYLVGEAELAHWLAEEARAPGEANHGCFADSVQPVLDAGLMETVADGADLCCGMALEATTLTVTPTPGHTPGHRALTLRRRDVTALLCGDAIHTPAQLYRPDWYSRFCSDGPLAVATRRALLQEATEHGHILVPGHLRGAMAMRVHPLEAPHGDVWKPEWL